MTDLALFDLDTPAPRPTDPTPATELTHGLPRHVATRLEAAGVLTADGVGRTARTTRCRRCRALVIRGLDGDICAVSVTVDAIEVDEIGEALGIACRRGSWSLQRLSNAQKELRWTLNPRWPSNIRAGIHDPVFIGHQCNAPPPRTQRTRFRRDENIAIGFPENPPF